MFRDNRLEFICQGIICLVFFTLMAFAIIHGEDKWPPKQTSKSVELSRPLPATDERY